jgi:hypothetical protein
MTNKGYTGGTRAWAIAGPKTISAIKNPATQAPNLIAILSTFRSIEIIGVSVFHPGEFGALSR